MNKLLQRQFRKHFDGADKVPDIFSALLNDISKSYDRYEKDQKMTGRSMELSSKKEADELTIANKELAFQNEEKEKRANELTVANKELAFQNKEKENRATELIIANKELAFQNEEKEKRANELTVANKELAFQNKEKENRAAELKIANKELAFQNEEKEKRANELTVANKELAFQNKEKENRAAELIIANKELAFQNEEKEKRANELIIANGELSFQNEEKETRAAELIITRNELEKSFSLLEATLESTADGILVVDINARVVRLNNKFIELWRVPPEILSTGDDEAGIAFVSGQLINPEEFISKIKDLNTRHEEISFDILKFKDGRVFERYSQPHLIKGKYVGRVWSFRDITDRKQAEDKIAESELRYRSLIEQATDTICIIDTNLKFSDINPSGCQMFGYSKEEMLQLSLADVLLEEDIKTNALKINELKSGNTIHTERRIKRKDGTLMEVELSGKMLEDGRILVFGRDISERKQAEKLVKESELRYRSLFEQASVAICITDASLKLYDMNPHGCRMLGYSKEEFLNLTIADLFFTEDLKAYPFKIEELKSGNAIRSDRRFKRKDGGIIDVDLSGKLMEDGRFIMFGRDMSERKQTEKLLKESELRYRNLIEQATDAICIADSAMKFIDVNRYACESLGYSKEEALQLSVIDILFTEDLASNPFKFDDVQPHEIIRNERRFKRKDGTSVIMEVSTRLTEDGRFIMFGHDVSDRKKSEEALRESEKWLRQIIDLVPHFIFAKDANGKFILANEAVAVAYGCTVENLIGKGDADFNSKKEEVEYFRQEDLKVISSGNVKYNIEETITDAAGNIRALSTTKIPYASPQVDGTGVLGVSVDITDRKKAEEQIKLSNERYELVIKTTNDMIWDWDLVNNTIFRNENYSRVFGADAADKNEVGKWVKRVHPDDKERAEEYIRQKVESPDAESWEVEFRYYRHDNEIAYLYDRGYIIRDGNKKAIRMVGATSDITERKKVEEALSNNELRFRTLTANAPVGIFQTDRKGKTIYVNETWRVFTGMSFEEAMGDGWIAAVHIDDRKKLAKEWNKKSQHGLKSSSEYRLVNKNGNNRWVSGEAVPLFNNAGEITGHIGTLSDITARKNAEAEIKRSEERYRQIVETAQEGIWVIDENNYTVFVNKKMCEMLGYPEDEILGRQNYFFKDDEEKIRAAGQIERRKNGIKESHDASYTTKNGNTVWGHVSSNPIYNDDGSYKGALAMITDITRRKQDEELLRKSEASMESKNKELELKNKELEQFAYVASHDMQEPLRTTSSFVELLQKQYTGKLDEKADKYLNFIAQSSDRMKVLIKDLLDYSRIGRKKELAEVDCDIMLQEVLADLGTAIKETQAKIIADPLPIINGYPTEIKQLFQNLIINAVKFRKENVSPQIIISVKREKHNWEFAFKDNGIGIDEQHKERIFIIFQRLHTRNEYEGSGIGLAHCKKIVELHGGKIWADSVPGQGTTFYFTIPKNIS